MFNLFDLEPLARIVLQVAALYFGYIIGRKIFDNYLGGVIGAIVVCWLLPKILLVI